MTVDTAAGGRPPGTRPPVLPSGEDPLVAGATQLIGGPPGRRVLLGERRFWSPLRWLLLLTLVTCALGFWQKAPCRVHDWSEEYQYTRACYTDVLALWYAERLDQGATPYLDHPVEYPVVIGGAMALAEAFVDDLVELRAGGRLRDAERGLQDALDAGPGGSQREQDARTELAAAEANARAHSFFDLSWVLLTVGALVVVVTTARLAGPRRVWDAALVAVAPALALHLTTNWDLLATALAGAGLLAWARRRPVLAGVLLGLGTATKLYPLVFLLPLLALCWRAGRLQEGLRTAVALAMTAAAVTVPVYLVSPSFAEVDGVQTVVAAPPLDRLGSEGLSALRPHVTALAPGGGEPVEGVNAVYRFVELNAERPADWDSLHYALSRTRDSLDGPLGAAYGGLADLVLGPAGASADERLNLSVAIGTVLALAAVVLLAVRAPRRPRLPQLLFLTVVGFLLVNKVWSPQYVLWLLPLAALARPRWRPFLAWQAAEAAVLLTRFYFFVSMPYGEGDQTSEGIDVAWFLSAVVVRDVALLLLAAAVVRDVLRPEEDVVRADGDDDPAGGVLDGAPDVSRRGGPAPARA